MRVPAFRRVWLVTLVANLCTWMNDVAAAWTMSMQTASPVWTGLVQTAALLPVFLLGLPAGALADRLDPKAFMLGTQLWVCLASAAMGIAAVTNLLSPALLLGLVFLNSVGLALRLPLLAAVLPSLVSPAQLPASMALNAVAMNAARILGPLLAGAVMASADTAWVFVLNTALSLLTLAMLLRWQVSRRADPLGPERFTRAIRVGLQYVRHSPQHQWVLLRTALFFLCASALLALLPLVAQRLPGGGAWTFTALIATMGLGAVLLTVGLPRLRQRYHTDALVWRGALAQALCLLGMGQADALWQALPLMLLAGGAWVTAGNTLAVASQQGLPNWVRGRGMSISQVTLMGASAAGAALWGQAVASIGLAPALELAAALLVTSLALIQWLWPQPMAAEDVTPRPLPPRPLAAPSVPGRIIMEIEYQVAPELADAFRALMLGEIRSSRLRHGCLAWELRWDLTQPERFMEIVVDASWTEHLRHFERITVGDVQWRERRMAFHSGPQAPTVRRYLQLESSQN